MERFIAIDTGKFATKVAEYNKEKKTIQKFTIRTAHCSGDFRDDAVEQNTVVISASNLGDKTYKVGNGARGLGAELTTDKKLEVHRICATTALTAVASAGEKDRFKVVVLLPAMDWADVSKREDFRSFILPTGDVTARMKGSGNSPVIEKNFSIDKVYVFPESMGALLMDETIKDVNETSVVGVIDCGNLNLNATLWQGCDLIQNSSATAELGGSMLIASIAQEISTHVTSCNEMIAAIILKEGTLPSGMNVTAEQKQEIMDIVGRVKHQYAEEIKRVCQKERWSLDLIKLIAIGGTSKDLKDELTNVFGKNLTVLENTEFVNAFGALRKLCLNEFDELIELK